MTNKQFFRILEPGTNLELFIFLFSEGTENINIDITAEIQYFTNTGRWIHVFYYLVGFGK